MQSKFKTVGVGGTFDELHSGHEALLAKAFEIGERVLIGLCSDDFAAKLRKSHDVAPYDDRLRDLKDFLREKGLSHRAEILELNDPFGVSLSEERIQALVVSKETEPMSAEINRKRKELGLEPLHIVVIEMVPSENHVPISTTRIHKGEIDRKGHVIKKKD